MKNVTNLRKERLFRAWENVEGNKPLTTDEQKVLLEGIHPKPLPKRVRKKLQLRGAANDN